MTDYTHYAASQLQRTPTLSVFSFFISPNCKEPKHVWIGWPMNSIVYLSFIIFVSDLENSKRNSLSLVYQVIFKGGGFKFGVGGYKYSAILIELAPYDKLLLSYSHKLCQNGLCGAYESRKFSCDEYY